jgi:23S rRNA pseudouridine1911/1915/1917 synthase
MKQISPETGVCFFRVEHAGGLRSFLAGADFSPLEAGPAVDHWLEFGCVYVDGRRRREDIDLHAGQVLRVHTRPKRFMAHPESLLPRLVENNRDFLVLDKPAGLPTHPTLDNFVENAKTRLERELGVPLFTTHRLDIPTQGLLLFAKSPDAQRRINRLFSLGKVQKTYRSLNIRPVEPGEYTHHMNPDSRVPKQVSTAKQDGWWECRLRIDMCRPVDGAFAHEITLLTGRTHQIRAQMAALGAPVIGDAAYGAPAEQPARERIALECFKLSFALRSQAFPISRPQSIFPLPPTRALLFDGPPEQP